MTDSSINNGYVSYDNLVQYDATLKTFILELLNETQTKSLDDLNQKIAYILNSKNISINDPAYLEFGKEDKSDFALNTFRVLVSTLYKAYEEKAFGLADALDTAEEIVSDEKMLARILRKIKNVLGVTDSYEFDSIWQEHFENSITMTNAIINNDTSIYVLGSLANTTLQNLGMPGGNVEWDGWQQTGTTVVQAIKNAFRSIEEATNLKNIGYSTLVSLRNNNSLQLGVFYRITDYVTKSEQTSTSSAEHQFDIVVLATSSNTLNENAIAMLHSGDTYFKKSNLDAWEIKYTIDNDYFQYAWAAAEYRNIDGGSSFYRYKNGDRIKDGTKMYAWRPENDTIIRYTTSTSATVNEYYTYDEVNDSWTKTDVSNFLVVNSGGKGVIYYMKDEFGNECPYDFKNIQFNINGTNYYTFDNSNRGYGDWSLNTNTNNNLKYVYNNIIKPCYRFDGLTPKKQYLPINIFRNEIGNVTYEVYNNILNNDCYKNTFKGNCYNNSFSNNCYNNSFGDYCCNNTFGFYFDNNTFGINNHDNNFGSNCTYNNFGTSCYFNKFGNSCLNNNFNSYCLYNSFGSYCYSNSFGSSCYYNSFGTNCSNNSLSSYNNNNILLNTVSYIKFNNLYFENFTIETGNQYINLNYSNTSSSNKVKNITVHKGVNNSTSYYTIDLKGTNQEFETHYHSVSDQSYDIIKNAYYLGYGNNDNPDNWTWYTCTIENGCAINNFGGNTLNTNNNYYMGISTINGKSGIINVTTSDISSKSSNYNEFGIQERDGKKFFRFSVKTQKSGYKVKYNISTNKYEFYE